VAAALWYPYRALPRDRVTRWSRETYVELAAVAESDPAAGVRLVPGRELVRGARSEPWWRDAVPTLKHVVPADLPAGYRDGWELSLPVADMQRYLPWLERRLAAQGASVSEGRVESIDEALRAAPIVVNCAGHAAGRLAGDDTVYPIRGQVVLVERPAAFGEWLLDQSDERALTYVVPREETVVLGGTAEVGNEDTDPDPTTARSIVARCAALVPALAGAPVVAHRVGLRPGRPTVRLEAERRPDGLVVQCYGHGGAGVTLSWGCAAEVAGLLETLT
jgi:D-amino-acid oxidase